ncbi:MAG: hypothetical protein WCC04_14215 [Terriglobales bacterium]
MATIVMGDEPDRVLSDCDVAVTVKSGLLGTVVGAWYVMVVVVLAAMKYPQGFELSVLELEQDVPVMVQATEVSVVFWGAAVNVICEGADGAEMGA